MKRVAIGLACAVVAGAVQADKLYKCTDPATGKITISQTQCALDAQDLTVNVHRPTPAQVAETQERAARNIERVDTIIELNRIAREHERLLTLERQRDAELANLARQRQTARNNLAGATYLNSLANREQAITERYNQQIDAARQSLDQRMGGQ